MKLVARAFSSLLPLWIGVVIPAASAQQIQPAQPARQARAFRVELAGVGAGTMLLPGVTDGHVQALLADEASGSTLQLEADVIPYHFLLEHTPAGAIHGGLYTLVDPESSDEPALVAQVEGEWAIDQDGVGTLAVLLAVDGGPGGAPRLAGTLRGSFRVLVSEPPARIAPPLYLPPPQVVARDQMAVTPAGQARTTVIAPVRGGPLPVVAPRTVSITSAGASAPAQPAADRSHIVIDSIEPPQVARVRFFWTLAL